MTSQATSNNEDQIIWNFDFALSTFYEIDTGEIKHLLPKRLVPMEAAPGVSLINVSAFNFKEGALGTLPEFQELILSVIVVPDLSRGVPKFAMFIISLSSTNQAHLEHCASYYKLPIFGQLSQVDIQRDAHQVTYADDAGPILTMKNIHPNPVFTPDERYFQAFVEEKGEIFIADLVIKAHLFEHQVAGDTGRLNTHPLFRGIDLDGGALTPYLQMLSQPGTFGQQFYARPEKFGQ